MKASSRGGARTDERGATAVEYALLISCILLVALGTMFAVGGDVLKMWQDSCNQLGSAMSAGSC